VLLLCSFSQLATEFFPEHFTTKKEFKTYVENAITHVLKSQHEDGGFSYWPGSKVDPYVTCYVTQALMAAFTWHRSQPVAQALVNSVN